MESGTTPIGSNPEKRGQPAACASWSRAFAAIGKLAGVPTFTAASRYRLGLGKLRRLLEGRR